MLAKHPRRQALYTALALAALHTAIAAQGLPPPPESPRPVVDYEYDANGNLTKVTQAKGQSGFNFATQNAYDTLDRLKTSTNAKAGVTELGYDGLDRTTQVTDPRKLVTQYQRNGLGDVSRLISPDTGTTNHTYDAAGNLTSRTDSRGVRAGYAWDALNRLRYVHYSGTGYTAETYGYTYDQNAAPYIVNGIGRTTGLDFPAGNHRYGYDPQGRVIYDQWQVFAATGINDRVHRVVSYTYDDAGNPTSITYPSGRVVTYTYSAGKLSAIDLKPNASGTAQALLSQIQHQPFGAVQSWHWHLASGTQAHQREFDTSGRLVRYRFGDTVRDLRYDAADRIVSYTHYSAATGAATPALDQSFGYDELGRLTSITTAHASWTIGYDANGNRTSVTLNGSTSVYTTAATSNRLQSITNPARSFGYDNAGNTTSDSTNYTATYGVSGRLQSITKAGITTSYAYNTLGQRLRKTQGNTASTRLYYYDINSGQLLGEYDSTGKPIIEYVWLGSTPVAAFTPDSANAANSPHTYYIHTDHLDTPRIVTDRSNNIRWRWIAEPFGTTAAETNPSGLGALAFNLRFPGQYFDQETGLHYNWHRDYDASTGRYVQSDPIGLAGGINTYAYVGVDPVSFIDPDGLRRDIALQAGAGGAAWGSGGGFVGGRMASHSTAATTGAAVAYATSKAKTEECKCQPATPENIRRAVAGSPMLTMQPSVSAPGVQEYVSFIQSGGSTPPIQVDENIIVDGNHRYIANLLCNREAPRAPGTAPLTRRAKAIPISQIAVDTISWRR